ncbi:MAG: ABC transporter ATPase [Candidatus Pelethousia sp.]|nr:ABC transporter ATPase [Candidatus Pelethousia sp.]
METEKLCTIQKRENLNTVYAVGELGPGGAYHDYEIHFGQKPGGDDTQGIICGSISFQKGPRNDNNSTHGVIDSDLLEIVRDRLRHFQQGEYATRENACALTHIEEALMWMNRRVEDRIEREVLGTYKI